MSEPIRPPKKPAKPPRRKHRLDTEKSWQNQDPSERTHTKRVPSRYGDPESPNFDPARVRDAYSNHPKDINDRWICGATAHSGKRCQRNAGQGTDHQGYGTCSFHGGNTPTHKGLAAMYHGVDVIDKMTVAYGYGTPLDISPQEALLQEVRRTGGHVAWLAEQISFWDMNVDEALTAQRQQWIELYHTERQMLVKVAKTAVDAGVAERQVRIAEQQGELIAAAFKLFISGLNLTVAQQRLVPKLLPQAMRQLSMHAGVVDGEVLDVQSG